PERARQVRRHVTLAAAALAAQHRDDTAHRGHPVGHAAALGADLFDQRRAVGFRQVAVGPDVEGHSQKMLCTTPRRHVATIDSWNMASWRPATPALRFPGL